MRQNGLRASSFVAVADVDPRIADQLLDLLAFAHVAAYAEPVPGRTGVYRDHHVPARPIDRLWVDRDATGPAREVLDRSLAHLHAELETALAEGVLAGGATTDRRDHLLERAADAPAPAAAEPGAGTGESATATGTIGDPTTTGTLGDATTTGAAQTESPTVDLPVEASSDEHPRARTSRDAEPPRLDPPTGDPSSDDARTGDPDDEGADTGGAAAEPRALDAPAADGRHEGSEAVAPRPPHRDEDLDQAAVDARWRDIVAGWDGPSGEGRGPAGPDPTASPPSARRQLPAGPPPHPLGSGTAWPTTAPPAAQPGDRRRTDRGPVDPARRRDPGAAGRPVDPPGPRDHTPPHEDEHFSPPVPATHPPLQKTTRLGWAGLVVGLVLLVVVVAIGDLLPRWVPLLAVALLVGGFAALVSRLHRSPTDEDDHDPDDGAVV